MKRKVRIYTVTVQVVLCLLSMSGCSDDVKPSKWDVHEEQQFKPIRQGTYKSELVIHRDECEPSLNEVIKSQVDWPPKGQIVSFDVSAEYPHDVLHPPVMFLYGVEVRTGHQYNMVEHLKNDFTPQLSRWMRPYVDLLHGYVQGGCTAELPYLMDWFYFDGNADVRAKIESDGTIRVDIDTVWNGMAECNGLFVDYNYFIPKKPCKESYSFRYVLEQACEPIDNCEVSGGWVSANTGPLEVTYTTSPIKCECKD